MSTLHGIGLKIGVLAFSSSEIPLAVAQSLDIISHITNCCKKAYCRRKMHKIVWLFHILFCRLIKQ